RRSVILLAAFPTAFFFLAPYSESLYLLLSLLSFRAARRDRWLAAGVFGAGTAATRVVGFLLAPALSIEAVHRWRKAKGSLSRRLAGACLVLVGPLAYLAYWATRGEPAQIYQTQGLWHRELSFPVSTLS